MNTIAIHAISSFLGMITPLLLFWRKKGTRYHVVIGRIFAILMFISSISSFLMVEPKDYSPIHILSALNIYWLYMAVYTVRGKPINWKYKHASYIGAVYISTTIAGIGVLVRHIILPGNSKAGYVASILVAIVASRALKKLVEKHKQPNRQV